METKRSAGSEVRSYGKGQYNSDNSDKGMDFHEKPDRVKNLLKMRSFKHSVVYFFKIWLDSISSKTANGMFVHCALFYFGQPAIRRGMYW